MSTDTDVALDKLDAFLERVPEMEEPPFDEAIRLALATGAFMKEQVCMINGQLYATDMEMNIRSLALRMVDISVTGNELTITTKVGDNVGQVMETADSPWHQVIGPLNEWLERHPEWFPPPPS